METRQQILDALRELDASRKALEELLAQSRQQALAQISEHTIARLSEEALQLYELVDYFEAHGGIARPADAVDFTFEPVTPSAARKAVRARGRKPYQERSMRKPTKPSQHFALKSDHTKVWSGRGFTPIWLRDACVGAGFDWATKEGRAQFAEVHMEPVGGLQEETPPVDMQSVASSQPVAPVDPTPLPLESEEDFAAAA